MANPALKEHQGVTMMRYTIKSTGWAHHIDSMRVRVERLTSQMDADARDEMDWLKELSRVLRTARGQVANGHE